MQQRQVQLSADWILVMLMLFIFWPVGLILLLRKIAKDRSATFNVKGGKLIGVVGWVLVIFGAIGVIAVISEGSNDWQAVLIPAAFAAGGLVVLWRSRIMQKNSKKYRLYISIVVNEGETQIKKIAESAGINQSEVEKDLQTMLDKGYFKGHINHKEKELVLARADVGNTGDMHTDIVRCHSCGADNKVIAGRVRKCEFCRSLVSAEHH